MATNGTEQVTGAAPPSDTAAAPSANLSKEEVAWYFVEQYYTNLSKTTEKLHLFYGKRSQFVYGQEAEIAEVSVGRQVIQERIKSLDFQDCKVRVSNVDSQASFDNIVIQVIGEMSNKNAEPKKFVQTFVLAQQPSGYFVLNDILRYIAEDDDQAPQGQQQEAQQQPEKEERQSTEQEQEKEQAVELVAEVVAAEETPAAAPVVEAELEAAEPESAEVETVEDEIVDEKAPESAVVADAEVTVEATETIEAKVAEPAAEETAKAPAEQAEQPKEPAPAPPAKPAAPVVAAPVEPAAPPKTMTWASRAAAAAGPRPVVPLPKTATPPAAAQTRAPAPAAAAAAAPAAAQQQAPAVVAAAAAPAADGPAKEASGWQTAGADSKRQNRPQAASVHASEKEGTMGYVKYVTEKVQDADLRTALSAHGELVHFDINRAKNCAFVEFKTVEAYQAAIASNPHVVNGESVMVEPRQPKPTSYGRSYGAGRGGASGRGRSGFDGSRNGGQGNPRGSFPGQSRGRGGAARARGGPQAAASS